MASLQTLIILSILGVVPILIPAAQEKKALHIGAFFGVNVTKDGGWNSEALISSLEMALHHINNDSTILKDYRLWYEWRDSKCDSGAGIRALLELVHDKPHHKIVFLGPGCSMAARPVAEAIRYWKSVQIGYSITSPIFTDELKFPHLFRTAPSELMENPARIAILRKLKWNKVALITQLLEIYVMTKENLLPLLSAENITLVTSEGFHDDPSHLIKILKNKDVRIIIALMYEDKFRKAMCQAYKEGLYGNKIVWIIVGWYSSDWWKTTYDVACTSEQLQIASNNLIETAPLDLTPSTEPLMLNKTAQDLDKEYLDIVKRKNMTYNLYSSFTYDAAWAIARMLHKAIPLLAKHNKTLEGLTYKDQIASDIFIQLLHKTDFNGMSGRVTFDKYGDRQTVIKIVQNKGCNKTQVGVYDVRNQRLNLSSTGFVWKDGRVPVAGTIQKDLVFTEPIAVTITFIALSTSGILFCLFCLAFNYCYRNHRFIKMSSPHFNNITVLGCCMCYIDILLSTITGSNLATWHTAICVLRPWFLSTGFTFAFGGMFAKTYRVYKIFTNTELRKELGPLGNSTLFIRLFVYWVGNVGLLLAWQIVDPIASQLDSIARKTKAEDEDFVYNFKFYRCQSSYYNHWVIALLGYQGLLLLFGMFLAWETRNVAHPALNDSKSIGLAVYNVFMFSSLTIFTEFLMKDIATKLLLSRIAVYACCTSTICLLFVPKIYHIKKGSKVNHVSSMHDASNHTNAE